MYRRQAVARRDAEGHILPREHANGQMTGVSANPTSPMIRRRRCIAEPRRLHRLRQKLLKGIAGMLTPRSAADTSHDLMSLGECMVRLSPPGHGRIEFSNTLEVWVGG